MEVINERKLNIRYEILLKNETGKTELGHLDFEYDKVEKEWQLNMKEKQHFYKSELEQFYNIILELNAESAAKEEVFEK